MRFRKLRIAWSVACLIACVLLIVLWVRSYWWVDIGFLTVALACAVALSIAVVVLMQIRPRLSLRNLRIPFSALDPVGAPRVLAIHLRTMTRYVPQLPLPTLRLRNCSSRTRKPASEQSTDNPVRRSRGRALA